MGAFDRLDREANERAVAARDAAEARGKTYSLTTEQRPGFDKCQSVVDEFLERMKLQRYPHLSQPISASGTKSGTKRKTIHGRGGRLTLHGWEPAASWGGLWGDDFVIYVTGNWSVSSRVADLESSEDGWSYGRDDEGFFVSGRSRGVLRPNSEALAARAHRQLTEFGA